MQPAQHEVSAEHCWRRFASEASARTSENRSSLERAASDEVAASAGGREKGAGRRRPPGRAQQKTQEMRRHADFWEGVSAGQACLLFDEVLDLHNRCFGIVRVRRRGRLCESWDPRDYGVKTRSAHSTARPAMG